jgi:type VI secretion system protein ImpA
MFNAETLLAPISPAQPAGADLSFSSDFDAIAQARRFDDPSLEQGEWVTELKEADWAFVVKRCATLLGEKSKDLRVAVWMAEAAAKQHRMQGLGESFRLLAGLIREYWNNGLYPEPDGDDMEQRVGNLAWILGRTPTLLREMPLTEGQGTAFSAIDFDMARKQASLPEHARNPDWPKLADMETARSRNSLLHGCLERTGTGVGRIPGQGQPRFCRCTRCGAGDDRCHAFACQPAGHGQHAARRGACR